MMMQKLLLLGFTIGISTGARAENFFPPQARSDFKCQKQVGQKLQEIFSAKPPEWQRVVDIDFETQAFRSPGASVGEWYELHIAEKNTPQLLFYSSAKTTELKWNKVCKTNFKKMPGFEFFKSKSNSIEESFSDKELARWIQSKKSAVIYLWSPRMVYSVTEWMRFRSAIEKRKMEFIPVLDPMVSIEEARQAMKKAGIELGVHLASLGREPSSVDFYKRLNSVDLYMRNGTLHFPTMFVLANGKLHPRRIVGVLTNEGLNKTLDEWMGELK